MRMKLIAEIMDGLAYHYYNNPRRVYVKVRDGLSVNPDGKVVRASKSTLVVPHEGGKMPYHQDDFKTTYIEPKGRNEGQGKRLLFIGGVFLVFAFIGACLLLGG